MAWTRFTHSHCTTLSCNVRKTVLRANTSVIGVSLYVLLRRLTISSRSLTALNNMPSRAERSKVT